MKPVDASLKSWVELVEKLLVVLTLVIAVAASAYKGVQLLGAKEQEAEALAEESSKRKEVLERFAHTYLAQLESINADLRKIDEELGKEMFKNTVGWDAKMAIRGEKTKDRQELLQNLGAQILELKRLEAGT